MSWVPGGPQWTPGAEGEQRIRMVRYATGKGGVGPTPWEQAEQEQGHASSSGLGLRRAAFIGAVAGVPAAFVLQLGMVRSLRMRQHALAPGLCPGVQHAVARDFFYLSGTQLQVQNRDMSNSTRALALLLTVLAPIPLDTFAVRAVEGGFRPAEHLTGGPLAVARALVPIQALLGRLLWIPAYNAVYVQGQYALGEGVAGMVAGSLAASFACYPLFIVKTQLLLGMQQQQQQQQQQKHTHQSATGAGGLGSQLWRAVRVSCGAPDGVALRSVLGGTGGGVLGGVRGVAGHLWRGVLPHAVANLGPDCLCMGAARLLYAELAAADDT